MKKDKKFDKMFPGLKGKEEKISSIINSFMDNDKLDLNTEGGQILSYSRKQIIKGMLPDEIFLKKHIIDNCLDKQRVREVIEDTIKITKNSLTKQLIYPVSKSIGNLFETIQKQLKEELGL